MSYWESARGSGIIEWRRRADGRRPRDLYGECRHA